MSLCDQRLSQFEFQEALVQAFPQLEAYFKKTQDQIQAGNPRTEAHRITYGDPSYPSAFRCLVDPPWTLTVLGNLGALHSKSVSIVGSREPREESLEWLEREVSTWPQRGWVFNSGGARGIDQKAHQICLRQNLPTVIFLPSGIDQIYPTSLAQWRMSVQSSGSCFVSEFEDHFAIRKFAFSFRNRLISALGRGILVAEAGDKSGSLMTGRIALEMGRPVFVIPGHPSQKNFRGSLDLLRCGAQWIENAQDLNLFLEEENNQSFGQSYI